MKDIKDYINNGINESVSSVDENMLNTVIEHLPELESLINKTLGSREKLNLKASIRHNRSHDTILIESGDLIHMLGNTLVKTLFTKIELGFWGGEYIEKDNTIWFNPQIGYTHPGRGSNGTQFIWDALYFDLDDNTWRPDGRIF